MRRSSSWPRVPDVGRGWLRVRRREYASETRARVHRMLKERFESLLAEENTMSDERRQLPSGHPHLCDCSATRQQCFGRPPSIAGPSRRRILHVAPSLCRAATGGCDRGHRRDALLGADRHWAVATSTRRVLSTKS